MFEGITAASSDAFKKLRGRGRLTEANIQRGPARGPPGLPRSRRQLQRRQRLHRPRRGASRSARTCSPASIPSEQIVKIVYDELVDLMGPVDHKIPLRQGPARRPHALRPPGSGKTTTAAKLALTLRERRAASRCSSPPTCSAPPPSSSCKMLGEQIGVPVYSESRRNPVDVCRNAVAQAKKTLLRHRHPRHRRPAAHRRDADGRAEADRQAGASRTRSTSSATR